MLEVSEKDWPIEKAERFKQVVESQLFGDFITHLVQRRDACLVIGAWEGFSGSRSAADAKNKEAIELAHAIEILAQYHRGDRQPVGVTIITRA